MHPFLTGLKPTLHIAHRGGAELMPENTLPAFRQAVERFRTDMLELDVHRTRDGELVVSHDPTVGRCTDGQGAINRMTLAEVRKLDAGYRFTPDGGRTFPFRGKGFGLPTFREVLDAFPGLRMNVDVKEDEPGIEKDFAKVVRDAKAIDRICCGSEWDALSARLHDALPEALHFYPREALVACVFAARMGQPVPEEPRYTVLDMPLYYEGMRLVDPAFLEALTRAGKWVNVWTIDDEADMERLVKEGVGGIMTDRPDLLRKVLDRR
jgi:glycerophosphoryl diester phosphodiesterase